MTMIPKYFFTVLFGCILLVSMVSSQGEDDEEDEEYDVDVPAPVVTSTVKTIVTSKAPMAPIPVRANPSTAPAPAPAIQGVVTSAPQYVDTEAPTTTTQRVRTTTIDPDYDEDEDEATTARTLRPAYILPLTNLLDSVGKGNITGIVDHALSFRAPPPVRDMVNMIMGSLFNMGQNLSTSMMTTVAVTSANLGTIIEKMAQGMVNVPLAPETEAPPIGDKANNVRNDNLGCKSKL